MRDAAAKRTGDEAAAWFARLSQVSVTTDTLRDFREWKRDPDNAAAYAKVEAAWDAAATLKHDPEIAAATAVAASGNRRRGVRSKDGKGPYMLGGVILAGIAAAAIWIVAESATTYTTGVGEQRLVVLSDGSRVRLNTDSVMRVRLNGRERHVELTRGEAFFEVRHDPNRPFQVQADGARIFDLGTKFDVRRTPSDVRVTLLEGRVEVAHAGDTTRTPLRPYQQLVVSATGISRPASVDAAQSSSWTSGRLIFQGEALADAVAEMNRYSTAKIVLEAPPEVARRPVSGVFDAGDSGAFLAAAEHLFGLRATRQPDGSTRLSPPAQGAPA